MIKLWDVAASRERASFKGIGRVCFSPDGKMLAVSGSGEDTSEALPVWLFEVAAGR
jgi:hypothetical protein